MATDPRAQGKPVEVFETFHDQVIEPIVAPANQVDYRGLFFWIRPRIENVDGGHDAERRAQLVRDEGEEVRLEGIEDSETLVRLFELARLPPSESTVRRRSRA